MLLREGERLCAVYEQIRIETRRLGKSFPGVRALDGVDMELLPGEVHAVVGANGAGKSTFAKALSGAYGSYDGAVYINGDLVNTTSPAEALGHGIACVHQEVDTVLISYLSAAENLTLFERSNPGAPVWVDSSRMMKRATEMVDSTGLSIEFDLSRPVSSLSLAEKQLLVIIRAISSGSRYIMFDEPTAALSSEEVKQLFRVIASLKEQGIGILYISHRMPEVFAIADKITVLRDGKKVGTVPSRKELLDDIIQMMLGKNIENLYYKKEVEVGDTFFVVNGLSSPGLVEDVSFELRRGEILGITGLVGAGKSELARVIFGAEPASEGSILIDGQEVKIKSPTDAVKQGIFLVPEERRHHGLLVEESVRNNISLPSISRMCNSMGMVNTRQEALHAKETVSNLNIVAASIFQLAKNLSGGNQQKVVVGKWMLRGDLYRSSVFILDDPTKGVDVGAKIEIYRLISELAERGKGIVYISPEIPEVLGICDRILVMYGKRIVAEMYRHEATSEKILEYATGGGR